VALLEMHNVVKRYRRGDEEVVALAGVDLAVEAGELVALIGRSGSGKSTLLHLAGGLDVPDAGTVAVAGRDLAELSVAERARVRRREVGFVFQFFHLLPGLSVAENVELPLLLDKRRRRRDRVATLLDRVGVAHRAGHRPGELSGGEMQRAAIARALVAEPRLLLADEPTGNLDSATAAGVLALLSEVVTEAGTTLVMVTHDEAAAALAGRILRLGDGRLATADGDGTEAVDVGGNGAGAGGATPGDLEMPAAGTATPTTRVDGA
jgi:ABC-type lipoprotein export system ATPase subunit